MASMHDPTAGDASQLPELLLTYVRWRNRRRRVRGDYETKGESYDQWSKVLAHRGSDVYQQFAYGTDTEAGTQPSKGDGPTQVAIICSVWSRVIAVDVDREDVFLATRTGQLIGRADAISTRGDDHYHILLDCRGVPESDWPPQRPIAGADIKSKGFIPVPGCEHYSGERYKPTYVPAPVIGTPELVAAILADQEDHRGQRGADGNGQGGGNGGGHDGEVAAAVLSMVRRGLSEAECYQQWLKIAVPRDPAWPFERADFERHHRTAVCKAQESGMEDQQATAAMAQWMNGVAGQPSSDVQPQTAAVLVPAKTSKPPNVTVQLLALAEQSYTLGITTTGEPFAVPKAGPNIARMLRGSRFSLRRELAAAYFTRHQGQVANAQALSSALEIIEARCEQAEPSELPLRVAEHDGRLVLDLGTTDGRAVIISEDGWKVEASPVVFRRTRQTVPLPVPVPGTGDLRPLTALLNVAGEDWPLVYACLVGTLLPSIPHPVVLLGGDAGSAKTDAARTLSSVLDPAAAQMRSIPRDPRSWAITAASSYVIAIDNISDIPVWWSDALCTAVTGQGWADRALYSDDDVAVLSFRRVIYLTSVDPGGLREDFASRLIRIRLNEIADADRRTEADVAAAWQAAHPVVLAGLLDLAAGVLAVLPDVQMDGMPRMADFARLLTALDGVAGTSGMARYTEAMEDLLTDVLDSDPVAVAVRDGITEPWKGTTKQLLDKLMAPFLARSKRQAPRYFPRDFPRSPMAMSARLRRAEPALRKLGWKVEHSRGTKGRRYVSITPPPADFEVMWDLADHDGSGDDDDED